MLNNLCSASLCSCASANSVVRVWSSSCHGRLTQLTSRSRCAFSTTVLANCFTEFCGNPRNGLVTYIRSQMDKRTDGQADNKTNGSYLHTLGFLLGKELLKRKQTGKKEWMNEWMNGERRKDLKRGSWRMFPINGS